MPCCGGLQIYPGQYKSPTGMQMKGCPIRLKEMNNQRNPAPTRLVGAQVAMGNSIRRRVSAMKTPDQCFGYKGEQCNPNIAYGPVFGLRQAPRFGSRCGDGGFRNIYYANHGDSSDVTMWKRLYGGPRQLFSTSACEFGCCSNKLANRPAPRAYYNNKREYGKLRECNTYYVTGNVQTGDALWIDNNTTPDFYAATVKKGGAKPCVNIIRTSRMRGYFSKPNRSLVVYRRDPLNQWKLVGTAQTAGALSSSVSGSSGGGSGNMGGAY